MFDLKEYEAVVNKYGTALYKYCLARLSLNKELCDEVYNDLLLVLYKKWDDLDKSRELGAWLYRCADRLISKARSQRAKYQSKLLSPDDCPELETQSTLDRYFSPKTSTSQQLEELCQRLSPEEERLFRLRYMEKATLESISSATGISYSTLRLRLSKLEKRIRSIVGELFEEIS